MPNRALVMSGSGSKGAFELGAVDYLVKEKKLDFHVIAGVSTGSLNAIMLAQGAGIDGLKQQLELLEQIWFGISSYRDVFRKRFLAKLLVLFAKPSLYEPNPLRKKIERYVDSTKLRNSDKQLRIGAVCLETGDYRSIDQTEREILTWTLASSSIPLMFPPVKCNGDSNVDGGVRNVTPLKDAFAALKQLRAYQPSAEPDEMYVVLASPPDVQKELRRWKDGLSIGKRTVTLLLNEVFREDITYALAVNHSVRAYEELRRELCRNPDLQPAVDILDQQTFAFRPPKYRAVSLYGIVPDKEYSESLDFDPVRIRAAFEAGREAAKAPLNESEMREMLSV